MVINNNINQGEEDNNNYHRKHALQHRVCPFSNKNKLLTHQCLEIFRIGNHYLLAFCPIYEQKEPKTSTYNKLGIALNFNPNKRKQLINQNRTQHKY